MLSKSIARVATYYFRQPSSLNACGEYEDAVDVFETKETDEDSPIKTTVHTFHAELDKRVLGMFDRLPDRDTVARVYNVHVKHLETIGAR